MSCKGMVRARRVPLQCIGMLRAGDVINPLGVKGGCTAAGFRITACAATPDQAAFVLSVPRRRPMDETQETLRTSAFPSTHVKDKCV